MAKVEAICISQKKGTVKREVNCAEFKADYGIIGDAHAGKWHRQVSLLPMESINSIKTKIPGLSNGDFAENIITSGVEYTNIRVGSRLRLGSDIVLEVTQIGKECHTACSIRNLIGDCIMPREGLFCRVQKGGYLKSGDSILCIYYNSCSI